MIKGTDAPDTNTGGTTLCYQQFNNTTECEDNSRTTSEALKRINAATENAQKMLNTRMSTITVARVMR